ncbi:MAG: hypothetical protein QF410_02465 [Planctomycetota bacterium]|jgi:hypothetical protein|nr:hypothetical protein [Planctomycetota bacterium]MDP6762368.1 hypothetical protein [Planctomycetota bacterium]
MKQLPLLAALASLVLGACTTSPSRDWDHWNAESVAPRMSRVFLGYEPDVDGSYRDYQWEQKKHINQLAKRYFLNWNPENPFQDEDPYWDAERPNHSPFPMPLHYFHLEALAFGGIFYAAGAGFIALPVDSILGTLEDGGTEEFVAGIGTTLDPLRELTVSFLNVACCESDQAQAAWRER